MRIFLFLFFKHENTLNLQSLIWINYDIKYPKNDKELRYRILKCINAHSNSRNNMQNY